MKRYLVVVLVSLSLLPVSTFSQTRKRQPRTRRPPVAAAQKADETVREGAARVADQIKILSHFLYLLGGVSKGIEQVDDAIRRRQASPALIEQAQKNRATVRRSIQGVRDGLDKLEWDFRTTPELARFHEKLAGVGSAAAVAEDQAAANQLDRAGRTLLGVVNQLTDVLLAMR